MSQLTRAHIRDLMGQVMKVQGKTLPENDDADLRAIGFRSLDFSELALRVEDEIGEELNFDAPGSGRSPPSATSSTSSNASRRQ